MKRTTRKIIIVLLVSICSCFLYANRSFTPSKKTFIWYLQHSSAKEIETSLHGIFKKEIEQNMVNIVANEANNAIIVKDFSKNREIMRECEEIIKRIDVKMGQVLIEVLVAELTLGNSLNYGTEWKYKQNFVFGQPKVSSNTEVDFGRINNAPAKVGLKGVKYSIINNPNLQTMINGLEEHNKLKILSSPHIMATNNKLATLMIGEEVPVINKTIINNEGVLINSFENKKVGIELKVTPHINHGGNVTLDILQKVNNILEYDSTNKAVRMANREVNTVITLHSNQTIVIGGFIKNNHRVDEERVPILGRIPLIGKLFTRRTTIEEKTELMVFITPRIINSWSEGDHVTRLQKTKLSKTEAIDRALEKIKNKEPPRKHDEDIIIARSCGNWAFTYDNPWIAKIIQTHPRRIKLKYLKWNPSLTPHGYGPSVERLSFYNTKLPESKMNYIFKKEFSIPDLDKYKYLKLSVASDNGAVVYLNGHLIDLDPAINKLGGHDFEYWNRFIKGIPTRIARKGKNTIVAFLKNEKTSSDAYFDLQLKGALKKRHHREVVKILK